MPTTQRGFLLIADISGYTIYLSQSELEHAQEVLQSLLELILDHMQPPLRVTELEGDAVFSHMLADISLDSQTFVEVVEDTYVAFRRAIDLMVMNNTCQCNACANIGSLDLKFFIHHGTFGIQSLGGHISPLGSEVILIHRLLKNRVTEQTGLRAYTLYTDAAIRQLGLEGFRDRLIPHEEEYEHLGKVLAWVQDMHPVWVQKRDALEITIPPERVNAQVQVDIALAPQLVWNYMTRTEYRRTLMGAEHLGVEGRIEGRIGEGSVYHCYHGQEGVTVQTVLQWRPFEVITTEDLVMPGVTVLVEYRLAPLESGTRMVVTFSKAKGPPSESQVADTVLLSMMDGFRTSGERFAEQITAEAHRAGETP